MYSTKSSSACADSISSAEIPYIFPIGFDAIIIAARFLSSGRSLLITMSTCPRPLYFVERSCGVCSPRYAFLHLSRRSRHDLESSLYLVYRSKWLLAILDLVGIYNF